MAVGQTELAPWVPLRYPKPSPKSMGRLLAHFLSGHSVSQAKKIDIPVAAAPISWAFPSMAPVATALSRLSERAAAKAAALAEARLQTKRKIEKSPPLVTVCIATYKRGRLLVETLKSVLRSSYPAIQIIVVEDGSGSLEQQQFGVELAKLIGADISDDTVASPADAQLAADALARPPIARKGKVLWTASHGASAARNLAAEVAWTDAQQFAERGGVPFHTDAPEVEPLILFFDSDDYMRPDMITRMVSAMLTEDADVVTVWPEAFRNKEQSTIGIESQAWRG